MSVIKFFTSLSFIVTYYLLLSIIIYYFCLFVGGGREEGWRRGGADGASYDKFVFSRQVSTVMFDLSLCINTQKLT